MYNIATLNKIAACGTDLFDKSKYTITEDIGSSNAVMVRSASMLDMEMPGSLLAIARAGAGVNNIPVEKCADLGICVFNTPGANANAVKELVICALFLTSRDITGAVDWAKTLKGKGAEVGKLVEKGKSQFVGPEISGKTLGIIGLGAIGVLVANAAVSLGMNVIGFDPYLSVKSALGLKPNIKVTNEIKDVYAAADYISLHLPYNAQTKNTVNEESLALMKDGVRILNFARGELCDNAAILAALESGKMGAYAVDFPADEVIGVKGVVAIPHLGASTPESEDNCAVMAALELIDYLENGNITNSVNLPDASMSAVGTKICIIHKNVPDVISKCTTVLGNAGINIENMINKSKKDYSYTMIDAIGDVSGVADKIESICNVIRVRVI
ncbi:MAG: 3-phosphoglycerate dehydrogenase [Ruminococcus sp.]|jgi:D-3-phosphoglycerate dehydrogenase|nr:3-phosphoglycerate dehydrogenase [Ruminococcus sp.]